MSRRVRQDADEALLMALACGATVENAAHKAGMSRRTAQRRLADSVFRQRLSERRADMVQRTAGMLTAASLESVKTLLTLQALPNPAGVRLGAARSVLDMALKLREASEWEERLMALERRLGANGAM
jgi:hypothetical protein